MQFIPYLNFNGNCAEAFAFYARLFGGTIVHQSTFGAVSYTHLTLPTTPYV